MRLTKIFDQTYKNDPGKIESALVIAVEYDPKSDTVTEIIDVYAYSRKYKTTTPLDQIVVQQLGEAFELILSSINWREIYRESKVKEAA